MFFVERSNISHFWITLGKNVNGIIAVTINKALHHDQIIESKLSFKGVELMGLMKSQFPPEWAAKQIEETGKKRLRNNESCLTMIFTTHSNTLQERNADCGKSVYAEI